MGCPFYLWVAMQNKSRGAIVDKRTGRPRMLAVDHNHVTGQIRSLLCMSCNQGLGNFQEDLQRLKKAVSYLESFTSKDTLPKENSHEL